MSDECHNCMLMYFIFKEVQCYTEYIRLRSDAANKLPQRQS